MPNPNPRIQRLKAMLGLEEKRVALQEQLDALQKQLSTLKDQLFDEASAGAAKVVAKIAPARKGRAQRGALKQQILAALNGAGSAGVRVTELAEAIGTKAANVHAWFHSTAKSIPSIVKVSGGHYRLNGKAPVTEKAQTPVKSKSRKKGKGKGAKRGELAASIQAALAAAGSEGLSIKELTTKTGAKYRNIAVWFVTTGKKFPKIKKVGPAHYKLVS
jgi:hypothetical protein